MPANEMAGEDVGDRRKRLHPFTNFQWYLTASRNSAYFASFCTLRIDAAETLKIAEQILRLAPQMNWRNDDRRQMHIDLSPVDVRNVCHHHEIDSFDGYPDRAIGPNEDLFTDPSRPAFRLDIYTLRKGESAEGNKSLLVVRASHALLEGIDSARLSRGLNVEHQLPDRSNSQPLARVAAMALGLLFVPINFAVTALFNRNRSEWGVGSLVLSRADLKRRSAELGVQQRSLIFSLIMYGFYYAGHDGETRAHTIGYSSLPPQRNDGDDPYVRLQMRTEKVGYRPEFLEYLKAVDKALAKPRGESSWLQMQYDAFFAIHRRIARLLPFLYRRSFFGFVPYDFLLSLVPPHVPGRGVFAHLGFNDMYCVSHAAGVNCCVIVPQIDRVSLSIYCPTRDLARISEIGTVARAAGVSTLPPAGTARAAIKARSAAEA